MRRTRHGFPVIERALREGLSSSVGTQVGSETERFHDRQVGEQGHHGCSRSLFFREHVTTTLCQNAVHVTHGILGHRDVTQVHGFEETWFTSQHGREAHTTSGGHNLTHTTMDSISVKDNIHKVEASTTHLFITERSTLSGPSETTDNGFLDLKQVVNTLGGINENVGASSFGSKSPDLTGFRDVPAIVVRQLTTKSLGFGSGLDFTIVDSLTELGGEEFGFHKQTVVLVGRFGQTGLTGLGGTSFAEGNDRVGNLDFGSHKVVLQVLQTNFEVELTRGSNNVFTGFFGVTQNHRIGLGQTLHTFHKLGKISRVLRLDGAADNRRYGELHRLNGAGIFLGSNSTGLEQVLVNTNQSTSVTSGDISNLFSVTTHHDNSTLNVLNPELGLLAGHIVGTHNADLLARGNLTRENTSKGVETTLIGGGDHLGDVHAERGTGRGVASTNGGGGLVVQRTVVKSIDTVLLSLGRGRQVQNNHLQNGVTGREPLLHDTLEELLSDKLLFVTLEFDIDGLEHLLDLTVLFVHDSFEQSGNGGGNELAESTFERASLAAAGPDLARGIKVPVAPKLFHHFVLGDTKLGTVVLGETLEGEGPLVETGTKGNGTLGGVHLDITESFVVVSGDNDVDGFDGTAESLVKFFSRELQLQQGTVDLVHHENGLDTLTNGLTQDSFGLHTHSVNGIDNDKGTVRDTKRSRNFGRKVNVTGTVNQVDQVRVLGNLDIGILFLCFLHFVFVRSGFFGRHTSEFTGLHVVLEKHGNTG